MGIRIFLSLIFLTIGTASQGQYIEVTLLNARTGKVATGARVGIPERWKTEVRGSSTSSGYGLSYFDAKPEAPAGVFISRRLDPGEYELLAQGRGYIEKLEKGVRVQENQTTRVKILLVPTLTVTGRVVDMRGKPAGGVHMTWQGGKARRMASTETKPDGTFILGGVEAGRGVIRFRGDYHLANRTVRIAKDANPPFIFKVKSRAALQVRFPGDALPENEVKIVVKHSERSARRTYRFRKAWVYESETYKDDSEAERWKSARETMDYALKIPPLRPGQYRIEAFWDGKALGSTELVLNVLETKIVSFGLDGSSRVEKEVELFSLTRLPLAESDMDDNPQTRPMTVVITWDAKKRKSRIFVPRTSRKDTEFTSDELKAWFYPIARSKIEKKTGFSGIPLVIRCDRDAPFRRVQHVLQLCADRDIQIYRIYLSVQRKRPDKKLTFGRLKTFLPTRDHPDDKIQIHLAIREGRCLCYVNGRCVGPLPDAAGKVHKMLEHLYSGPDAMVQIEPRTGVRLQSVVTIVDQCRRAKISRIAFSPVYD